MTTNVVNLFPAKQIAEFGLRPIEIDEWSDRLVRASVKWLHLRRCDALTFLQISTTMEESVVILEFDSNGRNAEIVSGSTNKARGWFGELLGRTVVPTLEFVDVPSGHMLSSPVLQHPVQFVFVPLPTGSQLFGAIVF